VKWAPSNPEKSADRIAVAGDPLQDVTVLKKVDYVMVRVNLWFGKLAKS
jgi:imidazolonepropionase-like amidohydrolase